MGKKALSNRETWQDYSGKKAGLAEKNFYEVFSENFKDTDFEIRAKPKEFLNIYKDVHLSKEELAAIYTPEEHGQKINRHGIAPDYAIDNTKTEQTLYIEVKRQDGWVEGGKRKDGRGNAHERSCKFFTPGLLKILRDKGKLGDEVLPFWTVFQGDLTRDPCRVREITTWYDGVEHHFFLWRNEKDPTKLIDHFNKNFKHLFTPSLFR